MDSERYRRVLEESEDFGTIFELVKEVVYKVTGLRRAGLTLGLADLPPTIAAYHPFASNAIVLNRLILRAVQKIAKDRVEVNAYIFTVLMHEYLHSLGILDEREVRPLVHKICAETLGERHPAVEMARKGLSDIFPRLLEAIEVSGEGVELVKDFDRSTITYIG